MWYLHFGSFSTSAVFLYSSKAVGFAGGIDLALFTLGPFGSFVPISWEKCRSFPPYQKFYFRIK
jgi:hypothetical protein